MIVWVLEQVWNVDIGLVVVVIDDKIIVVVVKDYGGIVIMICLDYVFGLDWICEVVVIVDLDRKYDIVLNFQGDVFLIELEVICVVFVLLSILDVVIGIIMIEFKWFEFWDDLNFVKVVIILNGYGYYKVFYFIWVIVLSGDGLFYYYIGIYVYWCVVLERFVFLLLFLLEIWEKLEQLCVFEVGM